MWGKSSNHELLRIIPNSKHSLLHDVTRAILQTENCRHEQIINCLNSSNLVIKAASASGHVPSCAELGNGCPAGHRGSCRWCSFRSRSEHHWDRHYHQALNKVAQQHSMSTGWLDEHRDTTTITNVLTSTSKRSPSSGRCRAEGHVIMTLYEYFWFASGSQQH